jgi:hypothetical protein
MSYHIGLFDDVRWEPVYLFVSKESRQRNLKFGMELLIIYHLALFKETFLV